jgi:hypothetical protein
VDRGWNAAPPAGEVGGALLGSSGSKAWSPRVVVGVALARRVADEEGGDPAEVIVDVLSWPRRYKRDIPKFGKGQAVIKASDIEAVEMVGLPYCLMCHDN